MKLSIFLFCILNFATLCNAHQDFYVIKDFGNVKVRVLTGFDYEFIDQAWMVGKLAEKLARMYQYEEQILLDIDHNYVGKLNTWEPRKIQLISFSKSCAWGNTGKLVDFLKHKSLVISVRTNSIDFQSILKLVEYGINNLSSIKNEEKLVKYKFKEYYDGYHVNSPDTTDIKIALLRNPSEKINEVIATGVTRIREDDNKGNLNYKFKKGEFLVFNTESDSVLLKLNSIYQFESLNDYSAIIFDSNKSFYTIVIGSNHSKVSERQILKDTNNYFEPYKIELSDSNKFIISFIYYGRENTGEPKNRKIEYNLQSQSLITDTESLLFEH